jgi:hypothetical protein
MNIIKKFLYNHKFLELNEDTLNCNVSVIYKGITFKTGNRKGYLVELYKDGTFFRTVSMKDIILC